MKIEEFDIISKVAKNFMDWYNFKAYTVRLNDWNNVSIQGFRDQNEHMLCTFDFTKDRNGHFTAQTVHNGVSIDINLSV